MPSDPFTFSCLIQSTLLTRAYSWILLTGKVVKKIGTMQWEKLWKAYMLLRWPHVERLSRSNVMMRLANWFNVLVWDYSVRESYLVKSSTRPSLQCTAVLWRGSIEHVRLDRSNYVSWRGLKGWVYSAPHEVLQWNHSEWAGFSIVRILGSSSRTWSISSTRRSLDLTNHLWRYGRLSDLVKGV